MLARIANLNLTVNQETSVGHLIKTRKKSAWRNTLLQTELHSNGTRKSIQQKLLILFSSMVCIVNLESQSKISQLTQKVRLLAVSLFLKSLLKTQQMMLSQTFQKIAHTLINVLQGLKFANIIKAIKNNSRSNANVASLKTRIMRLRATVLSQKRT